MQDNLTEIIGLKIGGGRTETEKDSSKYIVAQAFKPLLHCAPLRAHDCFQNSILEINLFLTLARGDNREAVGTEQANILHYNFV